MNNVEFCGKQKYESRNDAKRAMVAVNKRKGPSVRENFVFKCKTCGFWHWGVLPGSGIKRNRSYKY
jgi:hypothetical protein